MKIKLNRDRDEKQRFLKNHKIRNTGRTYFKKGHKINLNRKRLDMKGKHLSRKTEFKKGHKPSEKTREKQSDSKIKLYENGYINPMTGKHLSKESIKKRFISLKLRPTSYEKKISELCIEYNLPFIYTGDGTFLIGYKNPDFVNKKGRIAIEIYYGYWKIKDYGSCENYEKQRSKYFAKYGYKTIFIRDNEINNKDWKKVCLNKIIGVKI